MAKSKKIAAIIKILKTADAGYNNIMVVVNGKHIELIDYIEQLKKENK